MLNSEFTWVPSPSMIQVPVCHSNVSHVPFVLLALLKERYTTKMVKNCSLVKVNFNIAIVKLLNGSMTIAIHSSPH
jgi:hypothetical protein